MNSSDHQQAETSLDELRRWLEEMNSPATLKSIAGITTAVVFGIALLIIGRMWKKSDDDQAAGMRRAQRKAQQKIIEDEKNDTDPSASNPRGWWWS